ncbi:MAG: glycosyltransferase family 4 protein [Solirubrobacteraceae bacterium]
MSPNVHQVLSGAGPHDAVTTQARAIRERFRSWGWGGGDHASTIAPGLGGAVERLDRLSPAPDDVLLLHHSAAMPRLEELLARPQRKLLIYHNITPASWLWDQAPLMAVQCAVGREQLVELVREVDIAGAVSDFNAAELVALGARETRVVPLLLELERLGAVPSCGLAGAEGGPTILFVGRLSPHKRQDEVIRAFALFRRHRAPDARLVLVGEPLTPAYRDHLAALAEALVPGAVRFESGLSDAQLGDRYRAADAFLCLSEHEGFCIPLIEALHFGLPVVARPAGAVPETLADAGLLVDDDDLAVVAELLHLAVSDAPLRAELARRGAARLAAYAPERAAQRLGEAVEAAAAGPGPGQG